MTFSHISLLSPVLNFQTCVTVLYLIVTCTVVPAAVLVTASVSFGHGVGCLAVHRDGALAPGSGARDSPPTAPVETSYASGNHIGSFMKSPDFVIT